MSWEGDAPLQPLLQQPPGMPKQGVEGGARELHGAQQKIVSLTKLSAVQIIGSAFCKYFCIVLYYVHEESRHCTFSSLPSATLGAANQSFIFTHS